jgi:murein DD-endopeptidase MepM/ murein hydrolase activator NlpD
MIKTLGGYKMGSYNSQYENYYNNLVDKRKRYGSYGNSGRRRNSFPLDGNFFLKRLTTELIGVFILFVFVIACKMVVTPQTTAAYKYSKEVLNKSYDYNSAISTVKKLDLKSIEDKSIDWMENIKSKLTGTMTLKEKLKSTFMVPVEGTITSGFGERNDPFTNEKKTHEGIDIAVKEGTEVLCPGEGKVKALGEDEELGKYILIDHGNGIETKYAHLSQLLVKQDAEIKKGEVIAKSGNTGKSTAPHLHFELLYMGANENPQDYLNFNKN